MQMTEARRRRDAAQILTVDDILVRMVPHQSGCILWSGSCSSGPDGGYGEVKWRRKQVKVHRWAYEHFYGAIPNGMWVLHRCDVRNCVNPDHLFLGTHLDNMRDMIAKGRASFQTMPLSTHCGKGHKFTQQNTLFRLKRGKSARLCRECKNAALRRWWNKHRAAPNQGVNHANE